MYDYLPKAHCFEDFYGEYIDEVRRVVKDVTKKISLSQKERALLEAFENPNMHRNLVVGVGGYSEYFACFRTTLKK